MWIPVVMFFGSGCIDLMFGWYRTSTPVSISMQMAFAPSPLRWAAWWIGRSIQSKRGLPTRRDVLEDCCLESPILPCTLCSLLIPDSSSGNGRALLN